MSVLRRSAAPFCLILAILLLPGAELAAQKTGSIAGVVRKSDQGLPIEGARVSLVGTQLAALTNNKGEFSFRGLAPGKYVIQASIIGYATLNSEVEVRARETLEVEFQADSGGMRLPEIAVTEPPPPPNLPADFLRRSQEGGGRYFDRTAIERRNASTMGDLLRTVPGLSVDCRSTPCRVRLTRQMRNGCPMAFWLDGAPAEAGAVLLQPPRELDGVEVYSGLAETPPELYQSNTCGALAIWTRTPPRVVKQDKPAKP